MRIFICHEYTDTSQFYLKDGFCRGEIEPDTWEYVYNRYVNVFDSFSPNHYQMDSDTLILL